MIRRIMYFYSRGKYMHCFLTQAGEAEASRGQDVKGNGAAEMWRRSRGGRRTAAVTAGAGGD